MMTLTKSNFRLSGAVLFLIFIICSNPPTAHAQDNPNTITFENKSGEPAAVKLVGPSVLSVEVAQGENRTVNVAAGKYYILVRYGSKAGQYTYSKGDPFTVEQTATQYSAISITLHKVVDGNYPTHPTSRDEFDKAITSGKSAVVSPKLNPSTPKTSSSSKTKDRAGKKPGGLSSAPSGTTVEIFSIPSGLNIYLSPDTGQSPKPEDGSTPVLGSHPVVSDGFLKGVTPIVLRGLDPGKYLLAVSPTILIKNKVFQREDPFLDVRAFVSTNFLKFPPQLEGDVKGAVVYSVTIEQSAHTRFIVLAITMDASMEELTMLYPPRATFDVDEAKFAVELKQRSPEVYANFSSEANVRTMVDLLRRGGKAWLHEGDLGVMGAVREDGGIDFSFQVRLDGSWTSVRQ